MSKFTPQVVLLDKTHTKNIVNQKAATNKDRDEDKTKLDDDLAVMLAIQTLMSTKKSSSSTSTSPPPPSFNPVTTVLAENKEEKKHDKMISDMLPKLEMSSSLSSIAPQRPLPLPTGSLEWCNFLYAKLQETAISHTNHSRIGRALQHIILTNSFNGCDIFGTQGANSDPSLFTISVPAFCMETRNMFKFSEKAASWEEIFTYMKWMASLIRRGISLYANISTLPDYTIPLTTLFIEDDELLHCVISGSYPDGMTKLEHRKSLCSSAAQYYLGNKSTLSMTEHHTFLALWMWTTLEIAFESKPFDNDPEVDLLRMVALVKKAGYHSLWQFVHSSA